MGADQETKTTPAGCAVAIALAVGAIALEQYVQHQYSSSPLTSLPTNAKDELSNQILSNPRAHIDTEVAIRGDLRFVSSEKPTTWFSSPHGINYHTKSEDGTLFRSHYRLFDGDHQDRIEVRIDEYQEGGLLSSAKYTDYSGRYDLVGTIKEVNGVCILVVDHVPPQKIP